MSQQTVLDAVLRSFGFDLSVLRDQQDRDSLLAIFQTVNGTEEFYKTEANKILEARNLGRSTFNFSVGTTGLDEMRIAFGPVADDHAQIAVDLLAAKGAPGFTTTTYSAELLALTSLAYNGGILIEQKLANAIRDDNRAAAWLEIVAGSNQQRIFGVQNRRMQEATLFGLYDIENGTVSGNRRGNRRGRVGHFFQTPSTAELTTPIRVGPTQVIDAAQ